MLKLYSGNEINNNILKQMYSILIDNLFITYPSFLDNKEKHDNQENQKRWFNMIKTTSNYYVILYIENNQVIGFLNFCINNNKLWISEIQIKNEYKNKGILKRLTKKFVTLKQVKNFNSVIIHINEENNLSKKVFSHIGFKLIKESIYSINLLKLIKWANT